MDVVDAKTGICDGCGKPLIGVRSRCGSCSVMFRRARLKVEAIDRLGGFCNLCGWSGHPAGFEFHHRNPAEKEFTISCHWDKSRDTVLAEVDKCDLMCSRCHSIYHSSRYDDPLFLGHVFDYSGGVFPEFYQWQAESEIERMVSLWRSTERPRDHRRGLVKTCRICGRDGRGIRSKHNTCASCTSTSQRVRIMLAGINLLGAHCDECGWAGHPCGFSFHHNGSDKEFCISRAANRGWQRILSELDVCRLLCCNCHNVIHSNRFDGSRFELAMAYGVV